MKAPFHGNVLDDDLGVHIPERKTPTSPSRNDVEEIEMPPRVLRNGGKRLKSAEIQTSEDEVDGLATVRIRGNLRNSQMPKYLIWGRVKTTTNTTLTLNMMKTCIYETSTRYEDRQKCWFCNKQVNTNSSGRVRRISGSCKCYWSRRVRERDDRDHGGLQKSARRSNSKGMEEVNDCKTTHDVSQSSSSG